MIAVPLTRRRFLGALGGAAAAGFRSGIRLGLSGDAGRGGADLAVDEMSRTAALVGRTVQVVGEPTGEPLHALADLDSGRFRAGGEWFQVVAEAAARRAALDAWRREHGAGGHDALEWHPALRRFGAEQLNERFARRFGARIDAAAWIGWMLVKIPIEVALRSVNISTARFDGHKGAPLTFDARRRLVQPLCIADAEGKLLGVVPPAAEPP